MVKHKKKTLKKFGRVYNKANFKYKKISWYNRRFSKLKKHCFFFATFRLKSKYALAFIINIKPNNVFCHLVDKLKKKTLYKACSGLYNIKVSKKTMRFALKNIILTFLKKTNKYIKRNKDSVTRKKILVFLTTPTRGRKRFLMLLKPLLKKSCFFLKINEKKVFNGCRPCKKRKKKRLGLRYFK